MTILRSRGLAVCNVETFCRGIYFLDYTIRQCSRNGLCPSTTGQRPALSIIFDEGDERSFHVPETTVDPKDPLTSTLSVGNQSAKTGKGLLFCSLANVHSMGQSREELFSDRSFLQFLSPEHLNNVGKCLTYQS